MDMSHDVKVDTPQIILFDSPYAFVLKKRWCRHSSHGDCLKTAGVCGFILSAGLWIFLSDGCNADGVGNSESEDVSGAAALTVGQ